MKPEIYESLHLINAATRQITESIEFLKSEGLLLEHFAEIHKLAARQNCAEVNVSVVLELSDREQQNASRFEKERIQRERTLAESDQPGSAN